MNSDYVWVGPMGTEASVVLGEMAVMPWRFLRFALE